MREGPTARPPRRQLVRRPRQINIIRAAVRPRNAASGVSWSASISILSSAAQSPARCPADALPKTGYRIHMIQAHTQRTRPHYSDWDLRWNISVPVAGLLNCLPRYQSNSLTPAQPLRRCGKDVRDISGLNSKTSQAFSKCHHILQDWALYRWGTLELFVIYIASC